MAPLSELFSNLSCFFYLTDETNPLESVAPKTTGHSLGL